MSATQGRFLPLSALAILAGAAIGWLLRDPPAAPAPAPGQQPAPVAEAPPPAMLQAPMPVESKPALPTPKPVMARFSTGVEVALLNGVQESVGLPWPADRPWSPIAETVHDHRGIDWYRHADGSWSTTVMRMDEAKGVEVGVGIVYTDGGPPPPAHTYNVGIAPPAK